MMSTRQSMKRPLRILVQHLTRTGALLDGGQPQIVDKRLKNSYKPPTKPSLNANQKYHKLMYDLSFKSTHWWVRYSPNYGYEPYWVEGDWILEESHKLYRTKYPNEPTTTPLDVCEFECEQFYRDFGELCATNGAAYYSNYYKDHQYKVFKSYCHLLKYNCELEQGIKIWGIQLDWSNKEINKYKLVHMGPCQDDLDIFRFDYYDNGQWNELYVQHIRTKTYRLLSELSERVYKYNISTKFLLAPTDK